MEKPELHSKEVTPNQELCGNLEKKKIERVAKILRLVEKISESKEGILWPGIYPEVYARMKSDENEFPGYTTPIDEIIERCEKEGIKIVIGKHPGSGNVFVLPESSTNIEMDSIAPHQLVIEAVKNKDLEELIRLKIKKEII